ncbi:MAG: CBS domain-containing protein [Candidatus Thermoplasmatota archaeon]|nr:CBS domain-containing protein [Candidatus Thermoplasmatota archaeon]
MRTEAAISDVMTDNPVIISRKASVIDAAREMKGEDVGSIIVVDDGAPVGIATESDILRKVVAEGKDAAEISVDDIMSHPPVTITPDDNMMDAIRLMNDKKIRRLPVVDNGKLVGMVTEGDLLRISPLLLDVAREMASISGGEAAVPRKISLPGKCEGCGMLSDHLVDVDGRLFCESCADAYQ